MLINSDTNTFNNSKPPPFLIAMKLHSSYSRKVPAEQYGSISRTHGMEYYDDEYTPKEAHAICKAVVHEQIAEGLTECGLWRKEFHYKEES